MNGADKRRERERERVHVHVTSPSFILQFIKLPVVRESCCCHAMHEVRALRNSEIPVLNLQCTRETDMTAPLLEKANAIVPRSLLSKNFEAWTKALGHAL